MPTKDICVNAVCIIPGYRRKTSTSSSDILANPRTRTYEDVYLSSPRRTGNRQTPPDMVHQCLRMRFGVHRIHARIARPARLQDLDTRIRNFAGISMPWLRRGCRQVQRN